jgi:hypothetical protein
MRRVKPHPRGWLAGSAGLATIAATVLMAAFGTGASASTAAPSHARPHVHAPHVSPFGRGASRSARHDARRAAARPAVTTTKTLWVSNSVPVGHDTGCTSPGYETISSALTAAASFTTPTIKVCAGTYDEQLTITQSLTLAAKGSVTVAGPASPASNTNCDNDGGSQPNQDVVDICYPGTSGTAPSVTITGFTFAGGWAPDVCYDSIYGVAVLGGSSLTMSNSTVEDIGGSALTDGCQGGVGIEVGLATSATSADSGTATLTNDTVETYQKNGITVDGAGSNAIMSGVTVTGAGPTPAIAQNGIQVSDGATATISGSTVTGNECNDSAGGCGPNGFTQTQSCGLLMFDSGAVTVSSTTVSGNDIGAYNLEDYAWSYYTPPPSFSGIPVSFTGMGLNNRYENAYFDQGESTLSSSTLTGGIAGVEVVQYSGQTTSPNDTADGDTITGTSLGSSGSTGGTGAILVASDGANGDQAVSLTATQDKMGVSNSSGVVNQSTSVLTATGDWWGSASGPSVWSFGKGSSVTADVNFFPWETNSSLTHHKSCTTASTKTTTGNNVVLCAKSGSNAFLANGGTGNVLLIGNGRNDQLDGSNSTGETWIIGGVGGSNTINGRTGTGYIQERGNTNDTLINTSNYTVAAS